MKWEYSAGIIPFAQNKGKRKYLLLLSGLTKSELWEFPKGLIEPGETSKDAAIREFMEETGIAKVRLIPGFKKVLKYFYRREGALIGKTVTYFLGRIAYGRIVLSAESKEYAWLAPEEAAQKIHHKNILELLTAADDYLGSISRRQ
jgi:bis(5'-nucleosidyl)-tetraphosphatase